MNAPNPASILARMLRALDDDSISRVDVDSTPNVATAALHGLDAARVRVIVIVDE